MADNERSTAKTKRKELVKDGRQECWDNTTGESKLKKRKQEKKPTKRNNSKKEKKNMNNPDSDQSESYNPHSERRKPFNTKPDCDEGLVDLELINEQNVRQKDKKKRQIRSKNQKTVEDPDDSASERRERLTGNQAAESGEKKETIQTITNRGLKKAADRGHVSEKSKLKVKKTTETKKVIQTDNLNSKPLIVTTVEEVIFLIEEMNRDERNTDHDSYTNTTISFPTCSGVDQSESLQSDVSGLKDYRGVKLEVPNQNLQKKNKFWDKFQRRSRKFTNTVHFNM